MDFRINSYNPLQVILIINRLKDGVTGNRLYSKI